MIEKSNSLGGNLLAGGVPNLKNDDLKLCNWYINQLKKLSVDIKLNTSANETTVNNSQADVIIMATGSTPSIPKFDTKEEILSASDVLLNPSLASENVVIIGGGLVGCETGLWLSNMGKKVSIVEMLPVICGGPHNMPFMNWDMMKDLLPYNHI